VARPKLQSKLRSGLSSHAVEPSLENPPLEVVGSYQFAYPGAGCAAIVAKMDSREKNAACSKIARKMRSDETNFDNSAV
jgi:hypothetical protein